MAVQAIFFDLDDTLVVEEAAADAAFAATCERASKKYGIDPHALHHAVREHSRELWRAYPTIAYCRAIGISSWEGLWARFLGDDPNVKALREWAPSYRRESWTRALADQGVHNPAFAEELAVTYIEECRSRHTAFPDVKPALDELLGTYRLAIITNGVPDLQRDKIHRAGLARCFEAIIISGEIGFGKPDPRILALALDRLAVAAAESAMVGDNLERDIRPAQHAGMKGIWINRSGEECPEEPKPDAQIASLADLREVLQGWTIAG